MPDQVRDPEKLRHLGQVMDLDPDALLRAVGDDYADQLWAHPHIYTTAGGQKAGLLVLVLQQCRTMAEGSGQAQEEAPGPLGRTLRHVQAQLIVLVADYEQQLRAVREEFDGRS